MSLTHALLENGFRIGSVAGIPITVNRTWVPMAILVTVVLAGSFGTGFLGLPLAVAATLLFFGSILAHELGHALAARAFGIRTRSITLHLLGGVAKIEREPSTPKEEALVALAGPAVSFALAALFAINVAVGIFFGLPVALLEALGWLSAINLVLGLFNLVPGLPLDGGRVLRAWLWHRRGDRVSATRTAARGGEFVGLGLVGLALLRLLSGDLFGAIMTAALGFFIRSAAIAQGRASAPRELDLRRLLARFGPFGGSSQDARRLGLGDLLDHLRRARPPVDGAAPREEPVARYPDGREIYDLRDRR